MGAQRRGCFLTLSTPSSVKAALKCQSTVAGTRKGLKYSRNVDTQAHVGRPSPEALEEQSVNPFAQSEIFWRRRSKDL